MLVSNSRCGGTSEARLRKEESVGRGSMLRGLPQNFAKILRSQLQGFSAEAACPIITASWRLPSGCGSSGPSLILALESVVASAQFLCDFNFRRLDSSFQLWRSVG